MARLFVGTFLEREDREKIAALHEKNTHLEDLWHRKTRWVNASKLHLTWIFLGEVQDELIPKVKSSLGKLLREHKQKDREELSIEFSRVQVWPTPRKARMIVLCNEPTPRAVIALARTIRTGMIPFYSQETEQEHNRDFRPHITLMRLDRRKEEQPQPASTIDRKIETSSINSIKEVIPVRLKVESVSLVHSRLREGSSDYEVLESFSVPGM